MREETEMSLQELASRIRAQGLDGALCMQTWTIDTSKEQPCLIPCACYMFVKCGRLWAEKQIHITVMKAEDVSRMQCFIEQTLWWKRARPGKEDPGNLIAVWVK